MGIYKNGEYCFEGAIPKVRGSDLVKKGGTRKGGPIIEVH